MKCALYQAYMSFSLRSNCMLNKALSLYYLHLLSVLKKFVSQANDKSFVLDKYFFFISLPIDFKARIRENGRTVLFEDFCFLALFFFLPGVNTNMPSLSLSHGTLKSSPDENDNHHRLSIDALSKKICKRVITYKAQIYSFNKHSDPRDRDVVVVKFSADKNADLEAWAKCERWKSEFVRPLANKFNEFVRQVKRVRSNPSSIEGRRVMFLLCQTAELDSTSMADRARKRGDSLIFEDKLENFQHFMSSTGETVDGPKQGRPSRRGSVLNAEELRPRSRPIAIPATRYYRRPSLAVSTQCPRCSHAFSSDGDTPPSYEESEQIELERCIHISDSIDSATLSRNLDRRRSPSVNEVVDDDDLIEYDDSAVSNPLLQAFAHHFFCHTNGQAVVCGLKGTKEDDQYTLVTPVLHSLGRHFGHRDGGEQAMREVLAKHRCSWLCRDLPNVFTLLREAKRQRPFDWENVSADSQRRF